MSADNWTTCPRCTTLAVEHLQDERERVQALYGVATVTEFDEQRAALAALEQQKPTKTFREDYEFYGADEGEVTAAYRGICSVCDLSVSFEHRQPFYPEVAA